MRPVNRREFVKALVAGGATVGLGGLWACSGSDTDNHRPENVIDPFVGAEPTDVVSVVRIRDDDIDYAVREAIDLIGGIGWVTLGREKIMLKPNLVNPNPADTTNPEVIRALARLMGESGKEVVIGEGTAGTELNATSQGACRTNDVDTLNALQQDTWERLGYTHLARSLDAALINLHVGDMVPIVVEGGFVFDEISLHAALTDIDMLCSVPMMKTHGLAMVTLGMKNLFGLWPGQIYGTVRSAVHAMAAQVDPSGTAAAIIDMVRANKLGLVVVDASTAMQGQGPTQAQGGQLIPMNLIIAGTNALAVDMVSAYIMGFAPREIATFEWAWSAGMTPTDLSAIEVRGAHPNSVRRSFIRPRVVPYPATYGPPCPA